MNDEYRTLQPLWLELKRKRHFGLMNRSSDQQAHVIMRAMCSVHDYGLLDDDHELSDWVLKCILIDRVAKAAELACSNPWRRQ